jgi:hypothetical protein
LNYDIGPDLRGFSETVFFGLNLRQLFASAAGIVLSVLVWLCCHKTVGEEVTHWLCCAVVVPCACIGFIKVQNQPFERIAIAWLKYFLAERHELPFQSEDEELLEYKKAQKRHKIPEELPDAPAESVIEDEEKTEETPEPVVEEAPAEDAAQLRERIAELEAQLASRNGGERQ